MEVSWRTSGLLGEISEAEAKHSVSAAPKPLQDRRMAARLTFFYKVVEGLVPAISPDAFLKPQRPKRQIHAEKFQGFDSKNIEKFINPKTPNLS